MMRIRIMLRALLLSEIIVFHHPDPEAKEWVLRAFHHSSASPFLNEVSRHDSPFATCTLELQSSLYCVNNLES